MRRLDGGDLSIAAGEILGFARIRNEALRLPWCLDYHRRLGVDRFVIVDNDSTDGSREYLLTRQDVHLFWTPASYAESRGGMDWINGLLSELACGHWTLNIDADELLVYPGCEELGLRSLAAFLEAERREALACILIDMYSATSIRRTRYERGTDFLACCPYFDPDPPRDMRGGARERLFWGGETRPAKAPFLFKIPFVRWRQGLSYSASTHLIAGVAPARMRGGLLHFKLFDDFAGKVASAVEGRQYWEESGQYACYLAGLRENPDLTPFDARSVRYRNSRQLTGLGLLQTTTEYDRFVARMAAAGSLA